MGPGPPVVAQGATKISAAYSMRHPVRRPSGSQLEASPGSEPLVGWGHVHVGRWEVIILSRRGAGHKVPDTCTPWYAYAAMFGSSFINGGRFRTARAQRGHSANYYGDYPGNNPENHPPAESCTINSKLKNSNI